MAEKYILVAGFRRLTACKKLGYKKVRSYIKTNDKYDDIPIEDIKILDNTRKETKDEDINNLMLSIKSEGLFNPITIKPESKVTTEDFYLDNMIENLQRVDLTPVEFATGIRQLRKEGLNNSEIATRLGVSPNKVRTIASLSDGVMKPFVREAEYIRNRANKKGKLSISMLDAISKMAIPKSEKVKLLKVAKKQELSLYQMQVICKLIRWGMSVEDAVEKHHEYKNFIAYLPMNKKELAKYKGMRSMDVIKGILIGEIKPNKNLIFFG